jgi:hypothetical protein
VLPVLASVVRSAAKLALLGSKEPPLSVAPVDQFIQMVVLAKAMATS